MKLDFSAQHALVYHIIVIILHILLIIITIIHHHHHHHHHHNHHRHHDCDLFVIVITIIIMAITTASIFSFENMLVIFQSKVCSDFWPSGESDHLASFEIQGMAVQTLNRDLLFVYAMWPSPAIGPDLTCPLQILAHGVLMRSKRRRVGFFFRLTCWASN